MPIGRFFIEQHFEPFAELSIEGDERHHIVDVVRTTIGEQVELVNGKNQLAKAVLKTIEKKKASLLVEEVILSPPPLYQTILCQAVIRSQKLDWVLEKGTELGMTQLWLFPTERSEKALFSPTQKERHRHLLISALKQCGRLDLPSIHYLPPFFSWDESLFQGPAFYGSLASDAPPFSTFCKKNSNKKLFVGPEGGFSKKEEEFLIEKGIKKTSLHPLTLRAETAALVFLSLVSHLSMQNNNEMKN